MKNWDSVLCRIGYYFLSLAKAWFYDGIWNLEFTQHLSIGSVLLRKWEVVYFYCWIKIVFPQVRNQDTWDSGLKCLQYMYMFTFIGHYSNRRFIHAWKYSISFITKHNCTCTMALSPICRTLKSFYKLKWRYCLECKFKLFVICLSHIKLAILNNFFF